MKAARRLERAAERLIGPTENAKNCGEISRVCPECDGRGGFVVWHGRDEYFSPMSFDECQLCDGDGTIPKNEEDEV